MATTSSTTNAAVAADETIYSPIVEQGEFELEWRAYLPEDNDLETEHEEEGRISAEYAPTDSWSVELEPEFVRAPSKRLKLAQIQFEHVLQLTREDGHWTNCRLLLTMSTRLKTMRPARSCSGRCSSSQTGAL